MDADSSERLIVVSSRIHGRGVFALVDFGAGERLVEYSGQLISIAEAERRYAETAHEPGYTVLFDVGDDTVLDAGRGGNLARFINHGCEPNCAAELVGRRVFITAVRPITAGEELLFDYRLRLGGDQSAAAIGPDAFACACGSLRCRGTMLAP